MDPTIPRVIKLDLLLPKMGIPFFPRTITVKTRLKTDRNQTISIAGICGIYLTDTFIMAKKIPARSMD